MFRIKLFYIDCLFTKKCEMDELWKNVIVVIINLQVRLGSTVRNFPV